MTQQTQKERRIAVGDKVSWSTSRGRTQGRVVERREADFVFAKQKFTASHDDPAFVVKSDQTGDMAAHHARALRSLPTQRKG